MHSEKFSISQESCDVINNAKARGNKILAVGTTSMRTLETVADEHGIVKPMAGETSIFITPGYQFKCVDILLTNFHLPKSTLFMLVSAFAGLETMRSAYQHAIQENYRFYSYGDATLLFKGTDA
jgi:S-adenosylmethionine:tRNA ribosyltransferase-isomerase